MLAPELRFKELVYLKDFGLYRGIIKMAIFGKWVVVISLLENEI